MQAESTLPPTKLQKSKVLIVDDEPDVLTVFKKSLEKEGYFTYGFVNPAAALEHFRQNPKEYRVIVSDIRMPGLSGLELTREIKKINSDVKVVLMSSFEITKNEFDTVLPSLKVDALLDKPVRLEKLHAVMKSVAE